jgi:hypothetical protein
MSDGICFAGLDVHARKTAVAAVRLGSGEVWRAQLPGSSSAAIEWLQSLPLEEDGERDVAVLDALRGACAVCVRLEEADARDRRVCLQEPRERSAGLPAALGPGFFQVINRRYTRSSTIVTSNKRVSEWSALLGDEILASAILDRLLHDAEVLTINGPSWRLRGRNEILATPATQDTPTS